MLSEEEQDTMGIDKFIRSELWYTALNVVPPTNISSLSVEKTRNYLTELLNLLLQVDTTISIENIKQYQWTLYKLFKKLNSNDHMTATEQNIHKHFRKIQFLHALKLIDSNVPDFVQEELLVLLEYRAPINEISQATLDFLQLGFYRNPAFTCWVVNALYHQGFSSNKEDNILYNIYISILKEICEMDPLREDAYVDAKYHKIYPLESKADVYNNHLGIVLCILSTMHLNEKKEDEFLTQIFPMLLNKKRIQDVEVALYSRKSSKFLREYHTFATTELQHYEIDKEVDGTASYYIDGKSTLLRMVSKKLHWFLDIMDACRLLVAQGDYDRTSFIMSCPLLKSTWPTLLLKFLLDYPQKQTDSIESWWEENTCVRRSLLFLLDKCSAYTEEEDLVLHNVHTSFKNHLRIAEWILNNRKAAYLAAKETADGPALAAEQTLISTKYILLLLQNFGTLSVLRKTTDIHAIDYEEIKIVLKESLGHSASEPNNVLEAYFAVLNTLKAILSSTPRDNNTSKKQYETKCFSDMEFYLQSVHPLTLRLETMENIFSLLFMRHEDFKDDLDDAENTSSLDCKPRSELKSRRPQDQKRGFMCDKHIIQKIVAHLESSISTTEAEYERHKSEFGDLKTEQGGVAEKICALSEALMDAKWRLDLFTGQSSEATPEAVDTPEADPALSDQNDPEKVAPKTERKLSNEVDGAHQNNCTGRRRKHSRSVAPATFVGSVAGCEESNNDLINYMLASKDSLILRCLWKNDYAKAEQLVKMLEESKSTKLEADVRFSKALRTFRQDMSKDEQDGSSETTKLSDKKSMTPTLVETIRIAAQEGVQSSRHANRLETFLASQKAHVNQTGDNVATTSNDELLTLCVLDLALTIGRTYRLSSNICEVGLRHLKLCCTDNGHSTLPQNNSTTTLTEHVQFFSKIHALLRENKKETPITDILCDARIPLSVEDAKRKNDFWAAIANELQDYRKLNQQDLDKSAITNVCSWALTGMKKIIAICNDGNNKYLQNTHGHLQLLCSMIPHSLDCRSASIVRPRTISDFLRIPLHSYFAYQIFDLDIEPDQLEEMANRLRVNVVYVIFTSIHPKLFCFNYEKLCYTNLYGNGRGCVLLNDTKNYNDNPVQTPNECVVEILTELLQVLHTMSKNEKRTSDDCCQDCQDTTVIGSSRRRAFIENDQLQRILSKTSRLAKLDLGELSVGNDILAFFLNTWNVMFLHAILVCWADKPLLEGLQREISLSSVGYAIGDLGFVTLAALRSKLLGNSQSSTVSYDRRFFGEQQQGEELNEPAWQDLDLVQDPRVMFAMANEFQRTSMIRVYEAARLNEQLSAAQGDYDDQEDNVFPNDTPTDTFREFLNVEYLPQRCAYQLVLNNRPPITRPLKVHLEWEESRKIHTSLLRYLESHCWLLSYFAQQRMNENEDKGDNNEHVSDDTSLSSYNTIRTVCLENLLNSSWVKKVSAFFDNSKLLAAICDNHISTTKLWTYFEDQLKENNWENCLDVISALPRDFIERNLEIRCLRDVVLKHAIRQITKDQTASSSQNILRYLYRIKDIYGLTQTILENAKVWSMNVCENALLHASYHVDSDKLPMHCRLRIDEISKKAAIFRRMRPFLSDSKLLIDNKSTSWYEIAYHSSIIIAAENSNSKAIIESLISADKCELCLEWLECQTFPFKVQSLINEDFLIGLLKSEGFAHASKLLSALPPSRSFQMCKMVLKRLESIDALEFVVTYLLQHSKTPKQTVKYKRTLVGIGILKNLESKDRPLYIHLITEPLLMLEQLLMNCKFENIQKIFTAMQNESSSTEECDTGSWTSIRISFDETIRFYAKKSLDFRVSFSQRVDVGPENKVKTKASVTENDNGEFVMPATVPTKEEWVPNDKARECSCCKVVIFSMFNRRHHCRRCGRVVCAVCSHHRAIVPGYPSTVLVRVCNDCKRQTAEAASQLRSSAPSTSAASSDAGFNYWKLTKNQAHDRTIREEFSFEHAPNISLCLAILNLHSDHKAYTSFLLDRCDKMKRLLQPVEFGKINPEIDHAVIIKMMRSLLIAAKVKCAKLGFNSGLVHCDRFLSQVDLITTLVRSDLGLTLIPPTNDLDDHALRKLRDRFIDKEQWTLALDISTKAGLETQGVWAAWGKACLKVGYFERAREKLSHCLDKIAEEDLDDWVVLSHSSEMDASTVGTSKKNDAQKNRPAKDPSLLTEILQILENLRGNESRFVQQTTTAFLHQSVTSRSQMASSSTNLGTLPPNNTHSQTTSYYQESLYYLLTYGSFNSILEFFLKHDEYDKCLTYVLENDLDPETFFTGVYWYSMKNGTIEKLHDTMKTKDSSLIDWRKYLVHACRNLEKKQYLHALYQLQLFMNDYVRATMTCIRFYTNDANNYSDLCSRKYLLISAQKHLESELLAQVQDTNSVSKSTANNKRRKSSSSNHDMSTHHHQGFSSSTTTTGRFTMGMDPSEIDKHLNTICRQMEIAKFLRNGEEERRHPMKILSNLVKMEQECVLNSDNIRSDASNDTQLPTLFGDQRQKTHLAVLAILCGRNVEEGFGIAFRIMQDYNLRSQKVYSLAGHMLALRNDIGAIEQLVKCCRSSGAPNSFVTSDYLLTHCVKVLLDRLHNDDPTDVVIPKNHIDPLIRLIMDIELKINAYIESRQLKAAYLLAVKHSRAQDIKRILREADRLGQGAIKTICTKWLQQHSSKT